MHDSAKRSNGPLPSVRFARHRRFYRSELERRLARQRAYRHGIAARLHSEPTADVGLRS